MTDEHRTFSVQNVLRTAAQNVAAFEDHDLAAHLDDLASDYAGPYVDPEASRLLSPAYAHMKEIS